MRFHSFLFSFTFIALHALANETSPKVKHNYQVQHSVNTSKHFPPLMYSQSDVARLRKIVINRYYTLNIEVRHN